MEPSAEPVSHPLATPSDLRTFFDASLPLVHAYFVRRCRTSEIADDLTQDTFLAAAREIRRGSAVRAPDRWIFGLARHRLVDHYRSLEREQRKLRLVWTAKQMSERFADGVELSRERAWIALASVPLPHRLVLTLRYLDGLSVPEVASEIGRSIRATESLLARGRESFRRAYQEADDE